MARKTTTVQRHFLILHGPLLNRLGEREPAVYGNTTLRAVMKNLAQLAKAHDVRLLQHQTAHEGELVEMVANAAQRFHAVIINPGGFTHTSVALRDAVITCGVPVIEMHVSNIAAREPFRHHSLIAPVAAGSISGFGVAGYEIALLAALKITAG